MPPPDLRRNPNGKIPISSVKEFIQTNKQKFHRRFYSGSSVQTNINLFLYVYIKLFGHTTARLLNFFSSFLWHFNFDKVARFIAIDHFTGMISNQIQSDFLKFQFLKSFLMIYQNELHLSINCYSRFNFETSIKLLRSVLAWIWNFQKVIPNGFLWIFSLNEVIKIRLW